MFITSCSYFSNPFILFVISLTSSLFVAFISFLFFFHGKKVLFLLLEYSSLSKEITARIQHRDQVSIVESKSHNHLPHTEGVLWSPRVSIDVGLEFINLHAPGPSVCRFLHHDIDLPCSYTYSSLSSTGFPWRTGECIRFPGTEITVSSELSCVCVGTVN